MTISLLYIIGLIKQGAGFRVLDLSYWLDSQVSQQARLMNGMNTVHFGVRTKWQGKVIIIDISAITGSVLATTSYAEMNGVHSVQQPCQKGSSFIGLFALTTGLSLRSTACLHVCLLIYLANGITDYDWLANWLASLLAVYQSGWLGLTVRLFSYFSIGITDVSSILRIFQECIGGDGVETSFLIYSERLKYQVSATFEKHRVQFQLSAYFEWTQVKLTFGVPLKLTLTRGTNLELDVESGDGGRLVGPSCGGNCGLRLKTSIERDKISAFLFETDEVRKQEWISC